MGGWHHRLNGHEFEQTPGDSEGQGSLVGYSPWGHKELDVTELLTLSFSQNSRCDLKNECSLSTRKNIK